MEEIKLDIPKGYEFVGVDDNAQKVVFRKIQPEYPKTYEKCCEVLGKTKAYQSVSGYKTELLEDFQKLLICRDAYRKIVDWKPTKDDDGETFSLFYNRSSDKINKCNGLYESNAILDFPTKEMRDAFFENFKELIETCKELL